MAAQRGIGLIILVILAGLVVGSLLESFGSLFRLATPANSSLGPMIGLMPPATIDLRFLADARPVSANLVGVAGIVLAIPLFAALGAPGEGRAAGI
jgi:hypothetical protein